MRIKVSQSAKARVNRLPILGKEVEAYNPYLLKQEEIRAGKTKPIHSRKGGGGGGKRKVLQAFWESLTATKQLGEDAHSPLASEKEGKKKRG